MLVYICITHSAFVMTGEASQGWRPCCSISFHLEQSPSLTSLFPFSVVNQPMVLLPIEFYTGFDKVWGFFYFLCPNLVCIHWVKMSWNSNSVTLSQDTHGSLFNLCTVLPLELGPNHDWDLPFFRSVYTHCHPPCSRQHALLIFLTLLPMCVFTYIFFF